MATATRNIRSSMLLSTAVAALVALPGAARAQLVTSGDLVDATDSGGNGGRLTVVDTDATTTDMTVLSSVVVANWDRFNVPTGTTINIANGTAGPLATLVNRVVMANPSDISGSINAPDINFWLINQNGIVFGDGAAVNSASFFASTIDVANQDIFDFYEGTMLFDPSSDSLTFSGSIPGRGITASPNVTFVTDGSLMFVSRELNLDASFDAQSGRASFVTAADVDVTFTPGSPLTFVVNAGTTVAEALTVGGTVEGGGVDFAMFTAAGVVDAVLQVDATVAANAAVATDNGISLFASQAGAGTVTVELSDAIDSTGAIALQTDGDFITTAAIAGSTVQVSALGATTVDDVTATSGVVLLSALGGNLSAGAVEATSNIVFDLNASSSASFDSLVSTGGGITQAGPTPNSISVTGLTSGDASVSLRATNTITLGDVTSTSSGVSLSSVNGSITANDISSADSATLVAGNVIAAGDVSASSGSITLNAVNGITTTSVRAATGGSDIDSAGALDLGTLEAGGDIALDTLDSILTAAITAGGALTVGGAVVPSSVTFTGNASAASIAVDTSGAFGAQGLTATAGGIDIDAASITAGAVSATGGDVDLVAVGNITTASITSTTDAMLGGAIDVDSTGGGALDLGALDADLGITLDTAGTLTLGEVNAGGALDIGSTVMPSAATFNGNITAASFSFTTLNPFVAQDITTTAGDILIDAAAISAGALSATGGDVDLAATGAILTNSITATRASGVGGAVDVTSTANGLALGMVTATGGNVDLVARDTISTLSITATAGSGVGGAITVDSTGDDTLDLGDLVASGAIGLETADVVNYASISAGGALTVGATGAVAGFSGGDVTAASVTVDTLGDANMGEVTATAGTIDITADEIIGTSFSATGGDVVLLMNGQLFGAPAITANRVGMVGGAISVASTGGGLLSLGALDADGAITLDTTGNISVTDTITAGGALTIGGTAEPAEITLFDAVSAGSVTIDTVSDFSVLSGGIAATNGDVDIDAASITVGGPVSATGGDVILLASGGVFASGITATQVGMAGGAIDVDSTGGGALDLGALDADLGITLDTAGTLTLGEVNAGGALDIGSTLMPSAATFNGNITAASFSFTTLNPFVAQDITTTAGDLLIDAAAISAGALSATGGDVDLAATGSITTASITATTAAMAGGAIDIDSTGGGAFNLGALDADGVIALDTTGSLTTAAITAGGDLLVGSNRNSSSVTFTGNASAASMTVNTSGSLGAQGLATTAGDIDIVAASISAGAVSASGGDVDLLATGDITTASITATTAAMAGGAIDVDSTGGGALNLGALDADGAIELDTTGNVTTAAITAGGALAIGSGLGDPILIPGSVITGNVSAASVTIDALGAINTGNLAATAGSVELASSTITVGTVSATGGNVDLRAAGDIFASGITATQVGMAGGAIVAESASNGALNLGALNASGAITLDTGASVTTAAITAGGALTVGATNVPSSVTFTGNASAASITVDTSGGFTAQGLAATAGGVDVDAGSITAGAVSATGGSVVLAASGGITVASIVSTAVANVGGAIDLDSSGGGALDLGALSADRAIALDTTGSITAGTIAAGGNLTVGGTAQASAVAFIGDATALNINVSASGAFDALDLTAATGMIDVDVGGAITTGDLVADLIAMTGVGAITTGDIAVNELLTLAANGGDLTVGDVTLANLWAAMSLSARNGSRNVTAGTLRTNGGNILVSATNDITTGLVATTLGADGPVGTIGLHAGNTIATGDLIAGEDLLVSAMNFGAGTVTVGDDVRILVTGNIDTGAITATGLGDDISQANFVGAAGMSSLQLLDEGLVGSNIDLSAGGNVTTSDLMARNDLSVSANAITAGTVVATLGDAGLFATGAAATSAITASGAIAVESSGGGALGLGALTAGMGIMLDTTGSVNVTTIAAGGALAVGGTLTPNAVTFSGNASAASMDIETTGALTAQGLTSTAGAIAVDAGTITTGALSATGGGVDLLASGAVAIASATASGAIAVESSGGGALGLGALTAGMGIMLDTTGSVDVTTIAAGGALAVGGTLTPNAVTFSGNASAASMDIATSGALTAQGLTSTAGSIAVDAGTITTGALSATGGGVDLLASGAVAIASATASGAIAVESSGGGALGLGALTAGMGIMLDTTGSVNVTTIAAGGALAVGGTLTPNAVTFSGNASAASMDIVTNGALTAQGLTAPSGAIAITAADVALNTAAGGVRAASVNFTSADNGSIGLGSGEGSFSLSNEELALIDAGSLVIDAGSGDVDIADVTFADAAGREMVAVASTGAIVLTGNLAGSGAGRSFRLGGGADGTGVATRITVDINRAAIDFGAATLDLRGRDIAFGQIELLDQVANLSVQQLVEQFISNPTSLLYAPVGLIANPVYLTAGKLNVTYGGTAVFQNAAPPVGGTSEVFQGVQLAGGDLSTPTLTLNPLDSPQAGGQQAAPNAFALFGSINGFDGPAASLVGATVLNVNSATLIDASRVNGCVIGSGADCLTTIVGNFMMNIPREVVSLLVAEDGLLVPFDPLVGTNNEGLFSDAASAPANERECEERDAQGVCVSN